MAVNVLPWGNTCPLLKIAQHYKVPYELTLHLADRHQHHRRGSGDRAFLASTKTPIEIVDKVAQDVRYVCQWMADVRNGSIKL